jgi:hypothetical protein
LYYGWCQGIGSGASFGNITILSKKRLFDSFGKSALDTFTYLRSRIDGRKLAEMDSVSNSASNHDFHWRIDYVFLIVLRQLSIYVGSAFFIKALK